MGPGSHAERAQVAAISRSGEGVKASPQRNAARCGRGPGKSARRRHQPPRVQPPPEGQAQQLHPRAAAAAALVGIVQVQHLLRGDGGVDRVDVRLDGIALAPVGSE